MKINAGRWQIKECFRIMKTEFRARPVYVQRGDRIKAHFLTCFMALMVYRILEKELNDQFTTDQLIDTLKRMNMQCSEDRQVYIPAYTRTEITDALHENAGFRTDYEIITASGMRKIIRSTKKQLYIATFSMIKKWLQALFYGLLTTFYCQRWDYILNRIK